MVSIKYPLFVLLLCFAGLFSFAQPIRVSSDESMLIGKSLQIFVDSTNKASFEDVINNSKFEPSLSNVPNLGVADVTVWAKLDISNEAKSNKLTLQVENPLLDEVTLYRLSGDGAYDEKRISKDEPFTARGNKSQYYQYQLINIDGVSTYYLKIKSNTQLLIPVRVGTVEKVDEANMNRDLLMGLYFGIMLVMLLYNLFIYFSTKDKSYLYYILYIISVTLVQLNITGFGFKYLWPGAYQFEKLSVYLFPSFTAFTSIAFIRNFLHTKKYTPKLHKWFWIFIVAYIITIINAFVGSKHLSYNLLNVNALPLALYMIAIAGIIHFKHKYRPALFFLVAWTVFLISVMLFVMKDFGVLPYNLLTISIIQIGSAFVVVLLSIALADSINILRREKEESQEQALKALEENARIIREQNVILETRVQERTVELSKSNEELNKAMKELKEAEANLVESEKMASLGQLTAGIAHEINNPINFVTSNVRPLKRDVEMIIDLLSRVEEITYDEGLSFADRKEQIQELKEDLEYDYLKEEIEYLLKGITEGSSRTAEIVKGLRVFSRLDEDDLKKADLNEGLDSTLIIVKNSLNDRINIVKNYGNIPIVECYPGKLNQVFLNIITNGVQAIKAKYGEERGGEFTISTSSNEDSVIISLKDNGTGMDEETKKKVFEPFFTTKDVGEGTGLGMSIAYNTINKHNGKIDILSEPGIGTEFIITLPIIHVEVKPQEVG